MRVTVQLFARLREIAGQASVELDVTPPATVADVWQRLVARVPGLAPFGTAVSAAVNADFARKESPVEAGDEVAFLPPVSGGARR